MTDTKYTCVDCGGRHEMLTLCLKDKEAFPDEIYLIQDDLNVVWCDHPAPGLGMDEKDAVKYVRADTT